VRGGKPVRHPIRVKRKLVLFDIDGTLLLSDGAGRRSIHAALAEGGIDLARAGGIRFDGKTDPQIVIELLHAAGHPVPDDPERIARVLEKYLAYLERHLAELENQSRLMPGVLELLDALEADRGVVLGLLTGNVAAGARLKLRAVGLDPDRFVVGAYGSDHAQRGELPLIAARRAEPYFGRIPSGPDVVIIGDTPADVRCAEGIGARTIAVATGGYTTDELEQAGAHAVFADLSDLSRALDAILC
jgi:phosphoglycolate phosphatase-like HAD superfamily hydrolase